MPNCRSEPLTGGAKCWVTHLNLPFVQVARFSDGTRRITHITECVGMEGDLITMQDIFVFEKTGLTENGRVTGRFRATGIRPKFYERLRSSGMQLPASIFQTVVEIS